MKAYLSFDSFAQAMGSEQVGTLLQDLNFDVVQTGSLGMAWLEPLLRIETDPSIEQLIFANVNPERLPAIVKSLNHPNGSSASISDPLQEEYFSKQTRLVFDRAGRALPLDLPDAALLQKTLCREPQSIIDDLEISELRGRGGAGFPAHIKWRTVAQTPSDQKYIVCNADEGDSGTFSDRMLMEGDPFKLIEGMVISGYATGASKGYIYLRSEYPVALNYLERAIELAYSNGLLGESVVDSEFKFDLELFVGAGAYICGEETSLLESLEGKRGEIRAKPPLPAIEGLFGKPTLVHNVITLASVPGILDIGAAEYAQLGVDRSTGTMPFQISGNVKHGGLIELPFGASINELVYDFGGGSLSGRPVRAVQIGGPLGAYLSEAEFDTPLTYEAMSEIGAGIGHGGLVLFDDTVDMRQQAEYAFAFCEFESCGKCTPCRIGSVRGKEAIQQLQNGSDLRTIRVVEDLCDVMEQASLCQMGGMTPIPVLSALQRFSEDFFNTNP